MSITPYIRVMHSPLSISAHVSEPLLSVGLSENGLSLLRLDGIRDANDSVAMKFDVTHLFPDNSTGGGGGCQATALQPISGSNPHVYATSSSSCVHVFDGTRCGKNNVIKTYALNKSADGEKRIGNIIQPLDEHSFLIGDDIGGIHLFDERTDDVVAEILEQADYISSLQPVKIYGKNVILATSGDGTLCVYELRTMKKNKKIRLSYATDGGTHDDLLTLAVLENDNVAVAGTLTGALNLYNLRFLDENADPDSVAHVDRMHGHPECVNSVLPCGHNGVVLTASSDGFVRVVDVINKKLLGVLDYYSQHDEEEKLDEDIEDENENEDGNIDNNDNDNDNDNDNEDSDDNDDGDEDSDDEVQSTEQDEKYARDAIRERPITTKRKRKQTQRWPIEAMVGINGLSKPVFALLAHDRLIRFCDGAALADDDDDNEEDRETEGKASASQLNETSTGQSKQKQELAILPEAELSKKSKGKKKRRRFAKDDDDHEENDKKDRPDGFFSDL